MDYKNIEVILDDKEKSEKVISLVRKEIEDLEVKIKDSEYYDPNKNENAISIIKQTDGNYKGYTQRHGKLVEVRQYGPEVVLQELLIQG